MAGEAASRAHPATAHGAWLSGMSAAAAIFLYGARDGDDDDRDDIAQQQQQEEEEEQVELNSSSRWRLWYTESESSRGAGVPFYQNAGTNKVSWNAPAEGVFAAEERPPPPSPPRRPLPNKPRVVAGPKWARGCALVVRRAVAALDALQLRFW